MRLLFTIALLVAALPPVEAGARHHWQRCDSAWAPERPGVLLSEFTTRFQASHYGRAANVRLAALSLDGATIPPGGLLSYNRQVGPRDEEAGFLLAPAIDRGKKVDRWGGGVCQPSSTLHAAALLAGLEIVERRPHTWQSRYIKSGLDATVVWGRKDLVVRNPYEFPVRVWVEAGEQHITVQLRGARARSGWVTVNSRQIKQHEFRTEVEVDPELGPDDMLIMITGLPGARVERERIFHAPGQEPRRQPLPLDVYYPRDALVRIGPSESRVPTGMAGR